MIDQSKLKLRRKVIQIAIGQREYDEVVHEGDRLYALCDDGTIWYCNLCMEDGEWQWCTMHTVPQDPREDIPYVSDNYDDEGNLK